MCIKKRKLLFFRRRPNPSNISNKRTGKRRLVVCGSSLSSLLSRTIKESRGEESGCCNGRKCYQIRSLFSCKQSVLMTSVKVLDTKHTGRVLLFYCYIVFYVLEFRFIALLCILLTQKPFFFFYCRFPFFSIVDAIIVSYTSSCLQTWL